MSNSAEQSSDRSETHKPREVNRAQWKERFQNAIVPLTDGLYRFALRLTRNSAEAEDLVSETIMRAWDKIDTLNDPNAFKPWVFQILANLHRNALRKKGREVSFDEPQAEGKEFWIYENLVQPVLMWQSSPEQDFLNSVLRDDIKAAMDGLPDSYRSVVTLVLVDGFSYEEAAQILEVPVGTIRSRVSRGRSMMQERLWQHAKETGLACAGSDGGKKAD